MIPAQPALIYNYYMLLAVTRVKHTGVLAINGYLNSCLVVGILTFILSLWISSEKAMYFTIDIST